MAAPHHRSSLVWSALSFFLKARPPSAFFFSLLSSVLCISLVLFSSSLLASQEEPHVVGGGAVGGAVFSSSSSSVPSPPSSSWLSSVSSSWSVFMGPSFVVYGEATRIRHHMRESSIALHQHSSQAGQVGPSSGGGGGGDGTADTEDDDDSILTESEQDAEDECEAQEVMQRMITDELAGKSSSMLAASPQWKILKENLEKHADNLEMCTGAKTSSAAPVCRQISTSDKNDDKTGGGGPPRAAGDMKCGGRQYELLIEQYLQRNNCLASLVSSHTLAQTWLGHLDPSKAAGSSADVGAAGSNTEAVARRGIIEVIVGEYKKAMDSGVIDDQLWYIYEEASNILQDLKKGAIQGLNAFNSEEVRKVWVKRRTQQVAILCGLGNGKAAELGTSVIVNEGNLIFRVNLDGADDDAVTAYTHAIKSFAEHFVRALLEKGGLVDRAIELHKKFHKFRFYKIQGLMQNSEPSTDVREQNKLMNALPLVKHKKKKDLQKEGDNKSGGGAGGGDSSSQPPPPSAFLQVQQTSTTQQPSQDYPGTPPFPSSGVPATTAPAAAVIPSPGLPLVTQDPVAVWPAATYPQQQQQAPATPSAQPMYVTMPATGATMPSASVGPSAGEMLTPPMNAGSGGDQSSYPSSSGDQMQPAPSSLPVAGPPLFGATPQVIPGSVAVSTTPGSTDSDGSGGMMGGGQRDQQGGANNNNSIGNTGAPLIGVVTQPSAQQPPLSPLEEYESRGEGGNNNGMTMMSSQGGPLPGPTSNPPTMMMPLVIPQSPNDEQQHRSEGQQQQQMGGGGEGGGGGSGGQQGGGGASDARGPPSSSDRHMEILQQNSNAELPWKKNGEAAVNDMASASNHQHDEHPAKAVPIKTKITSIMSRLRMLDMKNDTVLFEPNKELVDSIVRAAYLDMSDRVLDVWGALLPQAAVTTTSQLITLLLPKPDVDFAEFYNKTINADGTITDGVTGQLPVNHTRLVERFALYIEEIYRECWRLFFSANDNFLTPPPPRRPDFPGGGATTFGLPSSSGGVSTLQVDDEGNVKEEPTAEDSFDSPSSALSTSALASLVPVKEHSFVKISAAAGVKSAQKNESAFPGVALVASSDGAPINDLTELVTDPDVVEKTAAQAFTAAGTSIFSMNSLSSWTLAVLTFGVVWLSSSSS